VFCFILFDSAGFFVGLVSLFIFPLVTCKRFFISSEKRDAARQKQLVSKSPAAYSLRISQLVVVFGFPLQDTRLIGGCGCLY
jgi:hypothetical protein